MIPVRPVLDTNVVLSALLFRAGQLSWMRATWRSGHIRPLASRATATELIRVLGYPKFALTTGEREDLLDDYLPICETVVMPDPPPPTPRVRDRCDRPVLELALAASADALVSGDGDILALADAFPLPVLSPAEFRRRLSGGWREE